ncbi:U6 small nuclear RNA (adenine-(43)-N(6))-methyltransferase [Lates japonicus]|uniref:U6 small nuclear RNA (Adenine-(43)-N(6))-methyltransferase n=1 Tax=Lates japonicus TaxID=270547 RepID=A0AAD3MNZ2_LATJO|nr:U6 small nuclear RNA (adenine-(43)-N(6))-methyltransferase [Lates japonicus]
MGAVTHSWFNDLASHPALSPEPTGNSCVWVGGEVSPTRPLPSPLPEGCHGAADWGYCEGENEPSLIVGLRLGQTSRLAVTPKSMLEHQSLVSWWYSCMLGKKCSLAPLKEELRKQGFCGDGPCGGRWLGFSDDVIVPSPPSKKRKLEKSRKPLSFTLPEAGLKELQVKASAIGCTAHGPVDSITALLERTLTDLRVLHKRVPCREQEQSLFLTAVENTWIHGRQKRREQKRQLRELPRAPHCAGASSQTTVASEAPTATLPSHNQPGFTQHSNTQGEDTQIKTTSVQELAKQQLKEETANGSSLNETCKDVTGNTTGEQKEVSEDATGEDVDMESTSLKETPAASSEPPSKRPLSPGAVEHFLFKCLLNVMLDEQDVMIEMHWVEGQNKDLMNQLCTYLKNTLLKSIAKS